MPKYYLNKDGKFIIEDYNHSKPFTSFFPGIAGKYGIPMWTFYVNRAQCISSFGIKDKDHAILEFYPANKAWQMVSTHGFRTFIKISSGKKTSFYEPFQNGLTKPDARISCNMSISSYDLTIEEINRSLGIKIKINYFNIPNDNYAGLVRSITITNLSNANRKIQLLDGLPQVTPFGTHNYFLKEMSRTIEAWMKVENIQNKAPFFRLAVDPSDKPEVVHINEGYFYLGFTSGEKSPLLLKPIIDPQEIFGAVTDFTNPLFFSSQGKFKYPFKQVNQGKTPCAFIFHEFQLNRQHHEVTINCIGGYARDLNTLNKNITKITHPQYLSLKKEENKLIIEALQDGIDTKSSSCEFNLYSRQTYLDNIIRGGYPFVFDNGSGNNIFYLYSRKHGDLERDYNRFNIQPTYFSQGNGNYRDVNQNRRCDIWFNPLVGKENLVSFFNLIQADGFNPLIVKGYSFTLENQDKLKKLLENKINPENLDKIMALLNNPFTPGDIIIKIENLKIDLGLSYDEFLNKLISCSVKNYEAEHGEGFWTDHWHYNLDLLENYLSIYPEQSKEIIFEDKCFTFFDNDEGVRPRHEKYVLYNNEPRQLHSVGINKTKRELIHRRKCLPHIARSNYGEGEIYKTTLIDKLICLFVNKIASLDPFGIGIEMEANKPNWYDSLNGLPALFGSSLCETFELKRLVIFILNTIEESKVEKIYLTKEIAEFIENIADIINKENGSLEASFQYWDRSSSLKEEYRKKTQLGFSGEQIEYDCIKLNQILNAALEKLDCGIKKALDKKSGIYHSYFINEVSKYSLGNKNYIIPTAFKQKKLSFFLEGQMHALRLSENKDSARKIYEDTKRSELYDKKLKMYKVTASLKKEPEEIGRSRVFPAGWLENESIWLHMEYKYILEMLQKGLFEEFYREFKNILIPFQKPYRYGRSILENSSFLASSAFLDHKLHGNGFVARLSGSTAEFLEIWITMNAGIKPFFIDQENKLCLKFNPILPGWLFNKKGEYSFNFLSKITVTYFNKKRLDTFGNKKARIARIILYTKNNPPQEIQSEIIPSPYSEQIRNRQIERIDIYLD